MFQSFEELEVWKTACQVSVSIFELLNECRVFSIPSNIAEGCERGGSSSGS